MSNRIWPEESEVSEEESEEVIPGKKYIKKAKRLKKKVDKIISSTYRKKKCEFYNRGACKKGSQCPFSHSFIPDVAKKICKFFLTDSCTKGEDCPYSHNTKRYPCKFYHIQQHCALGDECRFSHQEIDPDFEEEFLKDNEDFLVKIAKQERSLPEKYSSYVKNHNLLSEDRKKDDETLKPAINLPFIFGLNTYQTITKEEKIYDQSSQKKSTTQRKSSMSEQPFLIKLMAKNREKIPEKLNALEENLFEDVERSNNNESNKEESENEVVNSDKISQEVELTPESKTEKYYQGMEYYMCSYN